MQRAEKERGHPSFRSELRENRKALATFLDHFVWICFSTQWACGSITVTVTLTAREGSLGKEAGTVGPAWADDSLDSELLSRRDTCDRGHLPRATWGWTQRRMPSLAATPPAPMQEHPEMEVVSEKSEA